MSDTSIPALIGEETPCRVVLEASSVTVRAWTEGTLRALDPIPGEGSPRHRVRIEVPSGAVGFELTLGARMAPPFSVGDRVRVRALSAPTATGQQEIVAVLVDGQTRLFEGPLDVASELPDFTFARADSMLDPSTGSPRCAVHLHRGERVARLGGSEGFRVLEATDGRWLVSGGHSEGPYGYSVFSVCKLVANGVPAAPGLARPDDDRSVEVERVDGPISVRLASPMPTGAAEGVALRVTAVEVPDAHASTTWRVTLSPSGWRAMLGLAKPVAVIVSLPRGFALPLAVGDEVTLRALQAVAGNHPRRCVEVRAAGRTVLLDGDGDFLRGLADVAVRAGPCIDMGTSRGGAAPRMRGMMRVEVSGAAGYSDDAQRPRSLETSTGTALFAGEWTRYGSGNLPPGAAGNERVTLARLR